jgi:hypothetical protein
MWQHWAGREKVGIDSLIPMRDLERPGVRLQQFASIQSIGNSWTQFSLTPYLYSCVCILQMQDLRHQFTICT